MSSPTGSRTRSVRIAAAILASVILAAAVMTYLSYKSAFASVDTVTITSPRAGLVMEDDAKVKYRGIQIGKVTNIAYEGDQAKLTLAIDSGQLHFIPSNAPVQIAATTVFGAKGVEFMAPADPSEAALQPGAVIEASAVSLEVNTLFETLTNVLEKINPEQLSGTLTAVSEGLSNNGDDFGATLDGTNRLLGELNPMLPTLQDDILRTSVVANIYGDAGPALGEVFSHLPTINNTIVDQQDNLNAALLAATGLAENGYATLEPAAENYIAAIQRLRAPAKVLGEYAPEFPCLLQALNKALDAFGPVIGGTKPGLFVSSNFLPGAPSYTYPESLPIVNASGGPNCRGLPDMPSKQFNGSWYRAPFVVMDNALVPFQPNTELQFDAPSTLQFLFNGAFAERDDW